MKPLALSERAALGAIVRDLEARLPPPTKELELPGPEDLQTVAAVYKAFDSKYGRRPDYRLWRTEVAPYFAVHQPWRADIKPFSRSWTWPAVGKECARDKDPIVFWSVLSIAPEIIRSKLTSEEIDANAPIWEFSDNLYKTLRKMPPLAICPASCGIAAVHFLVRRQNLHYRAGKPFNIDQCDQLFQEIGRWLSIVDPTWRPRSKINLQRVVGERRGPRRLAPAHDTFEFTTLTKTLATLRPILSLTITHLDKRTDRLLHAAYEYAVTAWKTARARRLDEEAHAQKKGWSNRRSAIKRRRAFRHEFDCHLMATMAARDAGEYLESGKLAYLLFRLIPDEFMKDGHVKQELARRSIMFRYFKEVGLEVDPRFRTDDTSPVIVDLTRREQEARAARWNDKPQQELSALRPSQRWTGFMVRVERDQQKEQDWHTVLAALPNSSRETPVGRLLTVVKGLADAHLPASAEALIAATRLALRYGYVRSAGKILSRGVYENEFTVSVGLLVHFAKAVESCTQLDPFGMRHELIQSWHALIRRALSDQIQRGVTRRLSHSDRLFLHETVLGRTHVQQKQLGWRAATRLYSKAIGSFDVGELREFYDRQYDFTRKLSARATLPHLQTYCLSKSKGSLLGSPVAVSALRCGDHLSILVSNGFSSESTEIPIPRLDGDLESLRKDAQFWFKLPSLPKERQIAWPRSLRTLAATVVELVRRVDADARVIFLSTDAEMADLPWQHLIKRVWPTRDVVVALTPNFTTMLCPRARVGTGPFRTLLSAEAEAGIAALAAAVRATQEASSEIRGLSVIVGHGAPPLSDTVMSVALGEGKTVSTLSDWMPLLGNRAIIVHSCHGGRTTPHFMNELGGIAGIAISLGAELVIAPISEVHTSAAQTLHQRIVMNPSTPVGLAYLEAVRADPEVLLYNVFADPYFTLAAYKKKDATFEEVASTDGRSG